MKKPIFFFFLSMVLFGCASNQKATSIHKIWEFAKFDTVKSSLKDDSFKGLDKDTIDMRRKDTMLYYYKNGSKKEIKEYPYKIIGKDIYVDGQKEYTIMRLTDSTLEVSFVYEKMDINAYSTHITAVEVYKAKQ